MKNTKKRIDFASDVLKRRNIRHVVKNAERGYMLCFNRFGKKYEYYAGTGKIQGRKYIRGVFALADLIEEEEHERVYKEAL